MRVAWILATASPSFAGEGQDACRSERSRVTPAAYAYHEKHGGQALLFLREGEVSFERYAGGFDATKPHALYSGTKSFWGVCAIAARDDGLLSLDEPVWHGATIRQLLDLTAGAPFGGLGSAVPSFEKALAVLPTDLPGRSFTYGGIPLQIFGAVLSQRLAPRGTSAHAYLASAVLQPAGVHIASWRTLKDGTHPFPTGAFLAAREWARYGEYVREHRDRYAECFRGSAANPRYGLGWWLAPKGAPSDLFYASGSGGQALYVAPSAQTTIVRFAAGGSFAHETFLRRCELF
jgi:CubicO group peptidase (beta-lactamase class C family)